MDLGLPGAEYVRVVVPDVPVIQMPLPTPATSRVVPVEGPPGPEGPIGPRSDDILWFSGHGEPTPENTAGSSFGDMYEDLSTGLLYQLR